VDESIAEFRKAIALDANLPFVHEHLAFALLRQGRPDESIAESREALRLHDAAYAHSALRSALLERGRLDEALADWVLSHGGESGTDQMAQAFARQGRLEELRAAWQKALDGNPPEHESWFGYAELCLFLGRDDEYRRVRTALLTRFGDAADPIVAERTSRACLIMPWSGEDLRRAAALADRAAADTKNPYHAYFELAKGLAEYRLDRPEQAIPLLRESASQIPQLTPRLVLAMALYRTGQHGEAQQMLAAAVAAYHWDETRAASINDWIYYVLRREAEGLIVPNLSAYLSGGYQPRDNKERLELIGPCRFRKRHLAAARLYADAFADAAKLADDLNSGNRYNAACCAARAGHGDGVDAKELDEKDRARWRKQALDWLRGDLDGLEKRLKSGKPEDRTTLTATLKHWQRATDLVGLRDAAELAKLPADEQEACKKLWTEVQALLGKTEAKK
jgi:tetratricopeptide (TPR) repeat protein